MFIKTSIFKNFNPHSREGSDGRLLKKMGSRYISIHTPAKGVTTGVSQLTGKITISIHTPAKGVTISVVLIRNIKRISIHTPAKGVTSRFRNYWIFSRYFNPHSREGSDRPVVDFFAPYSISIHTPAKGVTIHTLVFFSFFLISIHTPAKGVTPLHSMFVHLLAISIHTPAKGVTTPFQSLSTLF